MTALPDAAWDLLGRAVREAPAVAEVAREWGARFDGALRVEVVGAPGSGRATVVEAVAGAAFDVVEGQGDVRVRLVRRPGEVVDGDAVSTIVVLSRADELGGGHGDAMECARVVAARHARDDLGEHCQAVVAVAALPAVGGLRLTRSDAAALSTLVNAPDALLSVDRLTAHVGPELPAKLGLFGVRAAVELVRQGSAVPAGLVALSGVPDLLAAIDTHFLARAAVLRARAALLALLPLLSGHPLSADVERVLTSAHEPRELRLLAELAAGRVTFDERDDEARHLLGGHGTAPGTRLALSGDPYQAYLRWHALTESPERTHAQRCAAGIVARTCEALVAVGFVE
ncbi:hypothetical protein JOD54_000097 [Actinokineospora baliensis]|uniref:hypothetical protein n=1 Tax=Actinokineospora baliensis TaxID=547056 RepID=UPI001956923A|nr:hypothetical protein [Actinokineospora baliensis]MBM7769893.1 hypothetical protein [Actinokineospora baliensis]